MILIHLKFLLSHQFYNILVFSYSIYKVEPFPYNPYIKLARMVGVEPTRRGVWNPSGYLSLTRLYFVTPVGLEPTVFRLKVGGLNQLSYEVILGVRPVTIRLSPLSQSGGSTISPSYTIYFCGADGLRSRSSDFSDQRNDHICHSSLSFVERVGIEPTPLNFQSNAIT